MLQKAAAATGHLYPLLDFDGITRRVPIFMRYRDGFYESFSLSMIRTYLGNAPAKITIEPLPFGNDATIPWVRVGDLQIPLDDSISALVPYRGATGVFRYISATDVIRGKLPVEELQDRIVIVGTSAQGCSTCARHRSARIPRGRGAREPHQRLPRPVDHASPLRGAHDLRLHGPPDRPALRVLLRG
jgi:CHASE2 domain-containing sensor protein